MIWLRVILVLVFWAVLFYGVAFVISRLVYCWMCNVESKEIDKRRNNGSKSKA